MNPGIIVCTRLDSKRLPQKAIHPIAGVPAIGILVERLLRGQIPVCIALSDEQKDAPIKKALDSADVQFFSGHPQSPLARMFWAAEEYGYDPIVRVTHDDILQDPALVQRMVDFQQAEGAEYVYISDCVRGMDCEIISRGLLQRAWRKFGDLADENISYMLKHEDFAARIMRYDPPIEYRTTASMTMDCPEDALALTALSKVLFYINNSALDEKDNLIESSGSDIVSALHDNSWLMEINHRPRLTVYTCAYNAEKTLARTIQSVLSQSYTDFKYLLFDDGSTDGTGRLMMQAHYHDPRVVFDRHDVNKGLASSCNKSLDFISREFCIRLDADDELLPDALDTLVRTMDANPLVFAIYPAYLRHNQILQNEEHHVGGAMMRTRMLKELRFCDGLRHWEGRELYARIVKRYAIMQLENPTWIYHINENSLSTDVTPKRARHLGYISG